MATRSDLLNAMPGVEDPRRLAQARQAQSRAAMTRQIAAAPTSPGAAPLGPQQATALGAEQAQKAGQATTQAVQRQGQQVTSAGQLALGQQQMQAQQDVASLRLDRERTGRQLEQEFATLARERKGDLFDRQLQFQTDEQGRAYLNEKQMMDWALSKGISEEKWKDYEQTARQATERQLMIMEAAFRKLSQTLENEAFQRRTDISQEAKLELARKKAALERELEKQRAAAKNRQTAWQAGGMVAGAVLGYGTPVGAAAGASLGGGVGSIVNSILP